MSNGNGSITANKIQNPTARQMRGKTKNFTFDLRAARHHTFTYRSY